MKNLITLLIILSASSYLSAQMSKYWESSSQEEKREGALRNYNAIRPLFERSVKDLSQKVDTNTVFPWEKQTKPDKESINRILDTISYSVRYEARVDEFCLYSRLKKEFGYDISDWYDFKILNYNLKDLKGQNIKREGNLNFNVWGISSKVKTFNLQFRKFDKPASLEGFIDVKLGFYTDCQVVQLKQSDIGKKFIIDTDEYEVLDIFDNTIVIAKLTGYFDDFNVYSDFNYLCTNKNLMSYSYSKDFHQSYAMYTKNSYDFFMSKPTLDQFYEYFSNNIESMINRNVDRNIIVMKFEGKIENIFFYRRINFIGREKQIIVERKNE